MMNEPNPQMANRLLLVICAGFVFLLLAAYAAYSLLQPAFTTHTALMGETVSSPQTIVSTSPAADDSNVPAFATINEFEADVVTQDKKGRVVPAHIYAKAGKVYSSMVINGIPTYVILRQDTGKLYQVIPSYGKMVTFKLTPSVERAFNPNSGDFHHWNAVGKETINGVDCTHFRVVDHAAKIVDIWADVAKQVPVLISRADGSYRVQWNSFKAGPVDDKWFVPPTNFEVIDQPFPLPDLPGEEDETPATADTPAPDRPPPLSPETAAQLKKLLETMQHNPTP